MHSSSLGIFLTDHVMVEVSYTFDQHCGLEIGKVMIGSTNIESILTDDHWDLIEYKIRQFHSER